MIKSFRKIRQKLLSENKFTKYLIYAFGEIIKAKQRVQLIAAGFLIGIHCNSLSFSYEGKYSLISP